MDVWFEYGWVGYVIQCDEGLSARTLVLLITLLVDGDRINFKTPNWKVKLYINISTKAK